MIARAVQENLRLVLEPTKGTRMNNARAVSLKFRAERVTRFGMFTPARVARFLRERRERGPLGCLHFLARLPARWQNGAATLIVRHSEDY